MNNSHADSAPSVNTLATKYENKVKYVSLCDQNFVHLSNKYLMRLLYGDAESQPISKS